VTNPENDPFGVGIESTSSSKEASM
jgi:hypothetical protein